jgi:hypothetical protein
MIHTAFDAIGDSLPRQVYLTLVRYTSYRPRVSEHDRID